LNIKQETETVNNPRLNDQSGRNIQRYMLNFQPGS